MFKCFRDWCSIVTDFSKIGVQLNKNRRFVLLLSFILVFTVTFNFIQKSIVDDEHTHYEHDTLIHVHQHTHQGNSHSHHHSTNSISILDYCYSSSDNKHINVNHNDQSHFELSSMNDSEYIDKLLKPPKFS